MIFLPFMPLPTTWTLIWIDDGHTFIAYFNFDKKFMKVYDVTASKLILQRLQLSPLKLKQIYLEMKDKIKEEEKPITNNGSAC